jgi:hypothetical protein
LGLIFLELGDDIDLANIKRGVELFSGKFEIKSIPNNSYEILIEIAFTIFPLIEQTVLFISINKNEGLPILFKIYQSAVSDL